MLEEPTPVTADGKGILDFSVYDAKKAGFSKVIFIIREDIADDFKELIGNRIAQSIPVEYVYQEMTILPEGRTKPFGTGHAVYCCKHAVKEPFALINADDYYGANAFYDIQKHLTTANKGEFAMTSFLLGNTLSKNGTVSRSICETENGFFKKVTEFTQIYPDGSYEKDGRRYAFPMDTPVSMNLWGLTTDIFDILEEEFAKFLKTADLIKDEFLITTAISGALESGRVTLKVFESTDKWYGITYREDLEEVKEAICGYVADGLYEGI